MSKMRKHGSHFSELPSLRQDVPKVRKNRSLGERVSIFGNSAPQGKGRRQDGRRRQKCAGTAKTSWNCGENGHMSSQYPKKKVHTGGGRFDHTSKTPEGRSATFRVQGLVFVSLFFFLPLFFWCGKGRGSGRERGMFHFLTSIAARFLVTFL